MAIIGVHYVLELCGCPAAKLDDPAFVRSALRGAARVARSTLLRDVSHRFDPQGITALALLAESHISVHTWPEHGYAAADIFTCGETAKPREACKFLIEQFEADQYSLKKLDRGSIVDRARSDREGDTPWQAPRFARTTG